MSNIRAKMDNQHQSIRSGRPRINLDSALVLRLAGYSEFLQGEAWQISV